MQCFRPHTLRVYSDPPHLSTLSLFLFGHLTLSRRTSTALSSLAPDTFPTIPPSSDYTVCVYWRMRTYQSLLYVPAFALTHCGCYPFQEAITVIPPSRLYLYNLRVVELAPAVLGNLRSLLLIIVSPLT